MLLATALWTLLRAWLLGSTTIALGTSHSAINSWSFCVVSIPQVGGLHHLYQRAA